MRYLTIIILLAAGLQACAVKENADSFSLQGEIKGAGDGMVSLRQFNSSIREQVVMDSVEMKGGKFSFQAQDSIQSDLWVLVIDTLGYVNIFLENSPMSLMASVGEKENPFENYLKEVKVSGSKLHKVYEKHEADVEAIQNKPDYEPLMSLSRTYNQLGPEAPPAVRDSLYMQLRSMDTISEKMRKEIHDFNTEYLFSNLSSPVSPAIYAPFEFNENILSFEGMTEVIEKLEGDATRTMSYKYMKSEYEAIASLLPGAVAPDFTLKTPEGNDLSLSITRGKYVLVDFWASWCKPCRASYPHLKKLYTQYKDRGFEVFAVSTDRDHEAWKKAIKEDRAQWPQVVDTFSKPRSPSDVSTLYAVPFLPTTYLLGPEGVILAKNLSEEELDARLKEIFGS